MECFFTKYSELAKESKEAGGVHNFINNLTEKGHVINMANKYKYVKEFGELKVITL
jgi:hypothetical protein